MTHEALVQSLARAMRAAETGDIEARTRLQRVKHLSRAIAGM